MMSRKKLEIKEANLRFMGSPFSRLLMHRDHEPEIFPPPSSRFGVFAVSPQVHAKRKDRPTAWIPFWRQSPIVSRKGRTGHFLLRIMTATDILV